MIIIIIIIIIIYTDDLFKTPFRDTNLWDFSVPLLLLILGTVCCCGGDVGNAGAHAFPYTPISV